MNLLGKNLCHDIVSPIPVRLNEVINYYSGVCMSGFRPYENGVYYSPMPFSGSVYKGNYDGK